MAQLISGIDNSNKNSDTPCQFTEKQETAEIGTTKPICSQEKQDVDIKTASDLIKKQELTVDGEYKELTKAKKAETTDCDVKENESENTETKQGVQVTAVLDECVTKNADGATSATTEETAETDPYKYIEYKQTTEIFKIELSLPKKIAYGQLRKKLNSLSLDPAKIKITDHSDRGCHAFVNLRSEEERNKALEQLNGLVWKGFTIKAKKANPAQDPYLKRKLEDVKQKEEDGQRDAKICRGSDPPVEDNTLTLAERVNQSVTPLWKLSYEEQLQTKTKEMQGFIKKMGRQIEKDNYSFYDWLKEQREKFGYCCQLHNIKPSPIVNGYRNKCEFSVGLSPEDIEKTVGFRLGRYKAGTISVVEVSECVNIPDSMKTITKAFQDFLQNESTIAGFNPIMNKGNWRMLTVRTTQEKDVMAIFTIHPQDLTKEDMDAESVKVSEYFQSGPGKTCGITSCYFNRQSERMDSTVNMELLFGEKSIQETLLEMKFQISPSAFFQVNTLAAEILYTQVGDWCSITPETVVLDICCGTGTIGLTMAKRVKKVIGIEMCKEAIDDAKVNAQLNSVTNAEFHVGKAEDVLPSLIRTIPSSSHVVAIVDPPRSGLHPKVVSAIRKASFVKSVVYVSCNPNGTQNNVLDLTRATSRRISGNPFKLYEAVPVDLFPHTSHCELVMRFGRE